MKTSFVICIALCLFGVLHAQKYTNKFDHVDVDAILGNNRILGNYIKCLLDKGPCTSEGRELKKLLPDALATDCAKCTDTQKLNSEKVMKYLKTNKPNEWKSITAKYDPQGRSAKSG